MLLFRNIKQTIRLLKTCMRANVAFSTKPHSAVDLAYKTFENVKTKNNLPPLIVMHGLFGSKYNWRGLAKLLLKQLENRKVILVDARNHGDSPHTNNQSYEDMAEDIVQLMKKLNINRACLLGHSMGGRCMMYTALKYPRLIEKLIVVDISPLSSSASLENMAIIIYALRSVDVSNQLDISEARKEANRQLVELNIFNRYFRSFLLTNFIKDQNGECRWKFNIDAISDSFTKHIIGFPKNASHLKYSGPVLFIGGADSDSISEDHLAKIQELYFPSAQLIMLQNAGHLIHVDQPNILVHLIIKFLQ